ncbi:hypothetical protein D3C87_1561100 [compost metagenome]
MKWPELHKARSGHTRPHENATACYERAASITSALCLIAEGASSVSTEGKEQAKRERAEDRIKFCAVLCEEG